MSSARNIKIGDFARHQYNDWYGIVINVEEKETLKYITIFSEKQKWDNGYTLKLISFITLELSQWRHIPQNKVELFLANKRKTSK